MPSMSGRLVHFGGRPAFLPFGKRFQDSPLLVGQVCAAGNRYCVHEVSGKGAFLAETPSTGDLTNFDQRHAAKIRVHTPFSFPEYRDDDRHRG
jgi:hypothetical protein